MLNIIHIASEVVPFAKTGGLADVAGALPLALAKEGAKISIILPYYTAKISAEKYKIRSADSSVEVRMGTNNLVGEVFSCKLSPQVTVYLIKQDKYFGRPELYQTADGDYPDNAERFLFFSRAALVLAGRLSPDIIHLHDWQAAMAAVFAKTTMQDVPSIARAKIVLTIHNLGYQGLFPAETMGLTGLPQEFFSVEKLEFYGKLNFLKGGIVFADAITTVSKKYAEEILTPEYGCGLEGVLATRVAHLYGIVNGIDYNEWDPSTDTHLPKKYSATHAPGKKVCKQMLQETCGLATRPQVPLIGIVSRLTAQKGFDILETALPMLMERELQMVILGSGEKKYQELLERAHRDYPQKVSVRIGFDNTLAHRIEAGSDFFLMPSRYEPCGLNQMISLKYGTLPIVRATGGLDDTIRHHENGFKFSAYSPQALIACVNEALTTFAQPNLLEKMRQTAFACDYSWNSSARQYLEVYNSLQG